MKRLALQAAEIMACYPKSEQVPSSYKPHVLAARRKMTDGLKVFNDYAITQKGKASRPYYTQTEQLIAHAIENYYKRYNREITISNLTRVNLTNPAAELCVLLCNFVEERLQDLMAENMEYHELYKTVRDEVNSIWKL